jgi:hypothetical protein
MLTSSSTKTARERTRILNNNNTSKKPQGYNRIKVRIGERIYTASMFDNSAANDLISLLPLTLTFRDYNGQEKVSPSPRALKMQGLPKGDDPEINDLGYYAPSGVLVLYYSDVGYWEGIVRLGRFDQSIEEIRAIPDGFRVTIERTD